MRSRAQSEALASTIAKFFLSLVHRLEAEGVFATVDIKLHKYALEVVDRDRLWELYIKERGARTAALRSMDDTRTPDFYTHAFLARAMVAPASALRGRAVHFIRTYADEGVEYASHLVRDEISVAFKQDWAALAEALTQGT
jgi:hypothetical protein